MRRAFTPSWLAAEPAATALMPRDFDDVEARLRAVARARARPIDPAVVAALAAQEARRPWSAARADNLEKLARGAAVVVSGQQVGLFLGPLYTLYKAAAAVVDARALAAESGAEVVPIFWLQTEDHDLDEVDRAVVVDGGALIDLRCGAERDEARVSLAERRLPASVGAALEGIRGPHAAEVIELVARHYREGAGWADAFAGLFAELFAEHGLLIFDPRAAVSLGEVARLAAPVHRFAIRQAEAIEAALVARCETLAAAGFEVQVPARSGCALSCYAAGPGAPRHRLERTDDGGWTTRALDAALTPTEIDRQLDEAPARFTTTALLRPILQDSLLPTAAYVGGPGELAYFAELGPLYELAGVPMPLVVPRARFDVTTPAARRLGEELGLALEDAARPRDELLARVCDARDGLDQVARAQATLQRALDEGIAALAAATASDKGFAKHAHKTGEQLTATIDKLAERARRAIVERDTLTSARVDRFQALLAPRGAPQERVLGFAALAAQVGPRALVDAAVASAIPFDGTKKVIAL